MQFAPVVRLWTRFVLFAAAAELVAVALSTLANIDAWLAFDDLRELCTDVGARILIAMLLAVVIATVMVLLCAPFIVRSPAASQRVEAVSRLGAAVIVLGCFCAIAGILIRWSLAVKLIWVTHQTSIYLWEATSVMMVLGAIGWYAFARERDATMRRLVNGLSGRTTRRWVLAAGLGGLVTGFANRLDQRPGSRRVLLPRADKATDIVLVTFDAMCAEDMSCYGYGLQTTPCIDALARTSYVFSNFYSASTFTTPCIASLMTGCYPSTTHVYQYGGRLRGRFASDTLPRLLHAGGYSTAASVANPGAHPDCLGFGGDFDILPSPPILDWATRDASMVFRSAQFAADAARIAKFFPNMLEYLSPAHFGQVHSTYPPELSFRQAERLLGQLPRPFFLWIHVLAPHFPYLPDPPFLHKFLSGQELRTQVEFFDLMDRKGYMYSPTRQAAVDRGRLRYDEWIAQSDAAFGQFVATLQSSGRFDDLALIVSSDHGESFSGGFLGHGDPQQRRPVLHIPLLIHLPRQAQRFDVDTVADQTALSPTLLRIAGRERPDWMEGKALLLQGEERSVRGCAFTQHLAPNHALRPVRHGTVGVIDGQRQYVFDLEMRRGSLFDLAQAHERRVDLEGVQPEVAALLQTSIRTRFPDLMRAS